MKRYGLKLTGSVGGDRTRFIAIRGIILFVAMFAALAEPRSGGPAIMFVGVALFLLFWVAEFIFPGEPAGSLQEQRYKKHTEKGLKLYEAGDYEGSVDAFRKAGIYGRLSDDYLDTRSNAKSKLGEKEPNH